jgi:hypothetical protein
MSENCCVPVDTGQDQETNPKIENCCSPTLAGNEATTLQTALCLTCGQKGIKVDNITLKAMLDVNLLAVRNVPYLFCRTADCPVIYFSADREQSFSKTQIRVPVHQKEPGDDNVLVCYCFRHSPATIQVEFLATGRSIVIEEINAGISAGQCACEIRNPQGSCCLGNSQAVVKQVAHDLNIAVPKL